eukprot:360056-Chlamydomonas_euryale.AAC.16
MGEHTTWSGEHVLPFRVLPPFPFPPFPPVCPFAPFMRCSPPGCWSCARCPPYTPGHPASCYAHWTAGRAHAVNRMHVCGGGGRRRAVRRAGSRGSAPGRVSGEGSSGGGVEMWMAWALEGVDCGKGRGQGDVQHECGCLFRCLFHRLRKGASLYPQHPSRSPVRCMCGYPFPVCVGTPPLHVWVPLPCMY